MGTYHKRKYGNGMVLMADVDHSGSAGGFDVNQCFSADFRNYVVYFALSNDRDGNTVNVSLKDSSNNADNTSGNYRYALHGRKADDTTKDHQSTSADRFNWPGIGGGDTNTGPRRSITLSGTIHVMNPQTASNHCHLLLNCQAKTDADLLYTMAGVWEYNTAGNQIYGLNFVPSANYFNTYNIKVYGLPESMSE